VGLFSGLRQRKGKEASAAREAGEDPTTLSQTKPEPAE
jgi:hypothetical protein